MVWPLLCGATWPPRWGGPRDGMGGTDGLRPRGLHRGVTSSIELLGGDSSGGRRPGTVQLSFHTPSAWDLQVWVRVPLTCEGRNATTTPCCPWSGLPAFSPSPLPSDQSYSFSDLCNLLEDLIAVEERSDHRSEGPHAGSGANELICWAGWEEP